MRALSAALVMGALGIVPAHGELSPETMNNTDISGAIVYPNGLPPAIIMKNLAANPVLPSTTVVLKADNTGNSDAGPAFLAAIKSNETLIVPSGTYLINTLVGKGNISNFTMMFMSGVTIKQAATLSNHLFQFNIAKNIHFTSVSNSLAFIDVSQAPNSGAGQFNDALDFTGLGNTDIEVDHIHFYSGTDYTTAGGDSHIFFSGVNGKFHHNIFEACQDNGIYISGPGGNVPLFDVDVHDNRFINCNAASDSKRSYQYVRWVNNYVENGGSGFASAEADTDQLPGKYNIFSGNQFVNMRGPGVISRISHNDIIEGNQFFNSCVADLISLQGTIRANVQGNSAYNDPAVCTSPSTQAMVRVQARTFNSITYNSTENSIKDNKSDGVYAFAHEDDTSQDANLYSNNGVANAGSATPIVTQGPKSFWSNYQTRRLQGVTSGFQGSEWTETQVGFQSTNSSAFNVFTLTPASNRAVRMVVHCISNTGGAAALGDTVYATFRKASGSDVTQVGTSTHVGTNNDYVGGSPGCDAVAEVSTETIRVRVTGIAGTTMNWLIYVGYEIVATNL